MKLVIIFSIIILTSCSNNEKSEKEFSFCECLEIEMKIQSETEGGDPKLAKELAEKRKKHCNHLQSLSTEEFYQKTKECN